MYATLLAAVKEEPTDHVLRFALADALLEAGRDDESHLVRADGWRWLWISCRSDYCLADVDGSGEQVKLAYFEAAYADELLAVYWRADAYDSPGDVSYQSDDPNALLVPTAARFTLRVPDVEPISRGEPLAGFCAAIERAGGWWFAPLPPFATAASTE